MTTSTSEFLVPQQEYLVAGIHIGTKIKTTPVKWFVYKEREDGLYILDIKKIDERLRMLAKMLARYRPEDVVITASRYYSSLAATRFSQLTGIKVITGRYLPGSICNLSSGNRIEPKLLFVCDPKGEAQAINEAGKHGIPVAALVDTDNSTAYVDFILPCNNKGKKSLSLIFWILAREYLLAKGMLKNPDEFSLKVKDFETSLQTANTIEDSTTQEEA